MTDRPEYVYLSSPSDNVVRSSATGLLLSACCTDITEAVRDLVEAAREARNDIEAETRARYRDSAGEIHPANVRREKRDLAIVEQIDAALAKFPEFREGGAS